MLYFVKTAQVVEERAAARRREAPPMSLETLERLRERHHGECLACSESRFRLEFACARDGTLVGSLRPREGMCSYPGVIHGGVVGLLIDEAMTCCLMAHGVVAVTGELNLRYAAPVRAGKVIEIRSRVVKTFAPLYHVTSELRQDGVTKVAGTGRFMRRTEQNS